MKIKLNNRRRAALVVVCFMVAMLIIIGGIGIYCMCKLCKKLPPPGESGGTNTNTASITMTIQKSANLCEWTNFVLLTGSVSSVGVSLSALTPNGEVLTNYQWAFGGQNNFTGQVVDLDASDRAFYRVIHTTTP